MPKIKNIIIFLAIGAIFVLIYVYFIKPKPPETDTLVSSSPDSVLPTSTANTLTAEENSAIAKEFLTLLLSVKSIKLNDAIFSDNAFISLRDSSITLVPDGNEGRINPFAPIGNEATPAFSPTCVLPQVLNTTTNTCVNPPIN